MKTFQTLLVKVARTSENEAILEKISKREKFSPENLHNFSGKKEVYFTSETASLGLAVATQRMLLRANSIKVVDDTQMLLPIIIAKYLVNSQAEKEKYIIEIEALQNVPFQSIQVPFF